MGGKSRTAHEVMLSKKALSDKKGGSKKNGFAVNTQVDAPDCLLSRQWTAGIIITRHGAMIYDVEAQVAVQKGIRPADENVTFSVCVLRTDGQAISGIYDAQLCICSQRKLRHQQDSKKLIPKNKWKSNHESFTRQCMLFNGVIDRSPCVNITTNITKLIEGKPPSSNDKLGVFVEISEEASGLSIVVSKMGEFKKWPKPKLEIKMLSSFRLGFPSFGNVIYRKYGSSTKDLVLIVREETNPSDGLMCPDTTFNTRLKQFIPVENGRDKCKFVLPPIDFENPASIVVPQVKPIDDSNGNESSKINGHVSGQKWISMPPPRQDLEACKS
ncbi:unnamed protein product [Hymenolepis diminuta]|uniref:Uncharacterized protein n=1 Tax=Hymenolepis diminuta TaxID=6216 RepID=A0A564ZD75_HYMDI|nr:unnamed protein product [Hymenolepis diminuta]